MMGSAQVDAPSLEPLKGTATPPPADLPSALKLEVAERLEAHRRRKSSSARAEAAQGAVGKPASSPTGGRRANLAATVAERYAQTPTYRAVLAEQAQRAVEQAAAAADVAVRSAQAVAEAQQHLLAELDLWTAPQEFTAVIAETVSAELASAATSAAGASHAGRSVREEHSPGLTVRLYEVADPVPSAPPPLPRRASAPPQRLAHDADEALALDDEIAFRQSPMFDDFGAHGEPSVGLPANLLEFPRQLIAARKARPRLAEGPLLEEANSRGPQLRIFEVEAEHFAPQPAVAAEVAPVQSFLYLDAQPAGEFEQDRSANLAWPLSSSLAPETATIARRFVALSVDALLVTAAVGAFAVTAAKIAGGLPAGGNAAITAAATLTAFWIVYQLLFFTLSNHTPGMRCARIGLCTLSDENPSRVAMRRRVLAQSVAILPCGIGILWALLDEDRLGWHDRMSKMYQRAY